MKPFKEFAFNYMEQLQHALDHLDLNKVKEAVDLISACRGTIWLIGNGGSAALASHMATDLALAGKRAIALTDVAALSTFANDSSWMDTFGMQLDRLGREGDILIAISGSGNSGNVWWAASVAKSSGLKVIVVTGFDGGRLARYGDIHINIPAQHMGVSQDGHQVALHMIAYHLIERRKVQ